MSGSAKKRPEAVKISQKAKLTEGKVNRQIVRMALPMFFGIIGMIAFNLIDTYFIGQLGTLE